MAAAPITVVELPSFLRSAALAGMTEDERSALVDYLARHPFAGDLIRETGGLRKFRWQRSGTGKSGGYRAIYYFHDARTPIFAFPAYGKNQQADLTPAQRKVTARLVAEIKALIRGRVGGEP